MALDADQYRIIVESAPNLIWRSGRDALCNYFNATWLKFTGRTLEQEMGNGWAEGVHPDDFDGCLKTYLDAFERRDGFEMIYRLKRHDGEWRWIHDKGTPFYDADAVFAGFIGSCIDITEQIIGETWKSMAQKDGLTGIYNRRYFEQEAVRQLEGARLQNRPMTVIMFDIDKFKNYNDRYGHATGDKILAAFADVLKDSIRDTDLLSRYGGDEFVLLLPDTGCTGAELIVKRVVDKCRLTPVAVPEGSIVISFSYGIAALSDGDTYDALIDRADRAMYAEKKSKYAF